MNRIRVSAKNAGTAFESLAVAYIAKHVDDLSEESA